MPSARVTVAPGVDRDIVAISQHEPVKPLCGIAIHADDAPAWLN